MQQLPLGIRLRVGSIFASYWPGPNSAALELLRNPAHLDACPPAIYLYGASGAGKTHLLQAVCASASERRATAAYLPLKDLLAYGPDLLAGCERLQLVCLDDFSAVAGRLEWERALFNLYRELEENGGKLLLADEQPPLSLGISLRDLASRILAGSVLRLQPLNEDEQSEALRLRATQRGLELPEETLSYLLRRLPRDMSSLCAFIDELDVASLVAQRRLTVPFVRAVLENKAAT